MLNHFDNSASRSVMKEVIKAAGLLLFFLFSRLSNLYAAENFADSHIHYNWDQRDETTVEEVVVITGVVVVVAGIVVGIVVVVVVVVEETVVVEVFFPPDVIIIPIKLQL